MNASPTTNTVEEFAPGVFWTLLQSPEASLLSHLLNPNAPYVLVWGHKVGRFAWEHFRLPVSNNGPEINVMSRMIEFDFVVPTPRFLELIPHVGPKIRAVQLHCAPPDFFDMNKIEGKERIRLLNECGWHVLLDTPANDFGYLMSPHRALVERAIEIHNANADR